MASGVSVRAEGLRRVHRRRAVLDVNEFEAPSCLTTAVLGPSGAGKSTLLSILGLLEPPDAGTVYFDGREVHARDAGARSECAAVFQRPYLFKGTVAANVAYGLRLRRVPADERRAAVTEVLARVGMGGWEDRSALTLSGGEAQRVALARALVLRPRLLLLDEPLASLDPLVKRSLVEEFAEVFRAQQTTVVYVTHDQDEAVDVSDRMVVMNEGRVVAAGPTDEIIRLPADEWTATFFDMEPPAAGLVGEVRDGLARIDCGGADVYAVADVEPRTQVAVSVRPEDVIVFEADVELPLSSARNRLPMTVTAMAPRGAVVRLVLELGRFRLAAVVSRSAVAELELRPGSSVLAVFKATAVRVARATPDPAPMPPGVS